MQGREGVRQAGSRAGCLRSMLPGAALSQQAPSLFSFLPASLAPWCARASLCVDLSSEVAKSTPSVLV